MLTESEKYEIIAPTLYLMISGMPDIRNTLMLAPEHIRITANALRIYRERTQSVTDNGSESDIEEFAKGYLKKIQASPSIGMSQLLNSFYFHKPDEPKLALEILDQHVIEDTFVSATDQAIKIVTTTLQKTA